MSQIQANNQFTQGSLATITVNTLDQYGHPLPPDNLIFPTANLDYQTPNGPVNIFTGRVCNSINTTFYYINIDTTLLSTGSYLVTLLWTINGQPMTGSSFSCMS